MMLPCFTQTAYRANNIGNIAKIGLNGELETVCCGYMTRFPAGGVELLRRTYRADNV